VAGIEKARATSARANPILLKGVAHEGGIRKNCRLDEVHGGPVHGAEAGGRLLKVEAEPETVNLAGPGERTAPYIDETPKNGLSM
jgi:hypothetical protein